MDLVSKVKVKYSYLTDDEAQYYVDLAKNLLIDLLYPNDLSISYETYEIPSRFDWWIVQCACEYIARDGMTSLTSYKENGISMTWDTSGISKQLINRITPIIGTVK